MSMIDIKIAEVQAELCWVRLQRQRAREKFVQDHVILAERRFFVSQEIDKLHNRSSIYKHIQVVQAASSFIKCSYIVVKEATLCRALYMGKVHTNELRVLVQQHQTMVDFMKQVRQHVEHITETREKALLRDIKTKSIDMAVIMALNQSTLKLQRQEIHQLGGDNEIIQALAALAVMSKSSSLSSSTSSLTMSFASMFKPPQNRRQSMDKTTWRRVSMPLIKAESIDARQSAEKTAWRRVSMPSIIAESIDGSQSMEKTTWWRGSMPLVKAESIDGRQSMEKTTRWRVSMPLRNAL
jgi:hypothetical protein